MELLRESSSQTISTTAPSINISSIKSEDDILATLSSSDLGIAASLEGSAAGSGGSESPFETRGQSSTESSIREEGESDEEAADALLSYVVSRSTTKNPALTKQITVLNSAYNSFLSPGNFPPSTSIARTLRHSEHSYDLQNYGSISPILPALDTPAEDNDGKVVAKDTVSFLPLFPTLPGPRRNLLISPIRAADKNNKDFDENKFSEQQYSILREGRFTDKLWPPQDLDDTQDIISNINSEDSDYNEYTISDSRFLSRGGIKRLPRGPNSLYCFISCCCSKKAWKVYYILVFLSIVFGLGVWVGFVVVADGDESEWIDKNIRKPGQKGRGEGLRGINRDNADNAIQTELW